MLFLQKGEDNLKPKKSDNYYVDMPENISKKVVSTVVARAAKSCGLYISHIGKYMAHKHPGSVHWHFKRDKTEPGILDATFYDVENLFWLMISHSNPQWVKNKVPELLAALEIEFARVKT